MDPAAPVALLQQIFAAIGTHNWLMAVPLLTIVLIYALRVIATKVVMLHWFATDPGGALLSLLGATATAVIAAATADGPHTFAQVVLVAFPVLVSNKMIFLWLKKLGIDLSVDAPAAPPSSGDISSAVKSVLVLFALTAGLLWSAPAQASCLGNESVVCNFGLSVPALAFRPGAVHPVQVAAGAGLQFYVSLESLDRVINGATWSLVGLQVTVLGTLISNAAGQQFGMLAAVAGPCVFNGVGCLSIGHDIVNSAGQFGGDMLILASGNIPFEIIPETSLAAAQRPPRGFTVRF